jgi:hypothetical protein
MARPVSRKGRLCLAFAGLAIGVGSATAAWIVDPKLMAAMGGIGAALALAANGLFYRPPGRKRAAEAVAHRDDSTAQAAEKTDTTTTNVRCVHCQHVQTVPVSQKTFVCEQCEARLRRRTAPAKSS